jgi:prepilin-type N-terminal cleavage/methylation domain-containing protein
MSVRFGMIENAGSQRHQTRVVSLLFSVEARSGLKFGRPMGQMRLAANLLGGGSSGIEKEPGCRTARVDFTPQHLGKIEMKTRLSSRRRSAGFTLTEVMIAVMVVAMLASIALPNFFRAQVRARNLIFATSVKKAAEGFEIYAWEHRGYPANSQPGVVPLGMDDYLQGMAWTEETPLGGKWNWDKNIQGYKAGIGVYQPKATDDQFLMIDEMIDDGDLSTGYFRARAGGYVYILEE